MSAAHWKLDNLIAIVDVNNQQADGPSTQMMAFEPLVEKLEAFGWFIQRVDGNDIDAVRAAFDAARDHAGAEAPHDRLRYPHGLRRAVPGRAREEPLHPRRCARMATGARRHSKPGGQA